MSAQSLASFARSETRLRGSVYASAAPLRSACDAGGIDPWRSHASVRSIAPVDLKVPDWLIEALRGEWPRVGEPDSLSAAEVVHPG